MNVKKYGANNKSPKQGRNARKPANKNSKQLKIMLISLGSLVVGLVIVGIIILGQLTNNDYTPLFVETAAIADVNAKTDAGDITPPHPEDDTISYNGKTYQRNENIVNIVFLGIDSTTKRDIGNHSDMMIVCAVDTVTKKAKLISVPRDIWTDISKVDTKTGKISEMTQNRLNAAYLFGGGANKYGANNTKACIQNFLERKVQLETPLDFTLDIPISFFASIDMDGISKIVDAVSGIEVTLDATIPNVGKKGKTLTLKGQKAEEYLRDRHNTAGSDFGRTSRQRDFMILLAKKIKTMGPVSAVTNLWDEFNSFGKTDLNLDQALAYAKILNGIDIDAIDKLAIPCNLGNVGEASVLFEDEAATVDLLLGVYYNEVK